MIYLASAIISISLMIVGTFYVRYYLKKRTEGVEYGDVKTDVSFPATVLPAAAFSCLAAFFLTALGDSKAEIIRYVTAFCGLLLCSITDIKIKLIPNVLCIGLVAAWLTELLCGWLFFEENILVELTASAIGGLLGGGLLFIGRLISRSGMGMGDIKLLFGAGLLLKFDKTFGLLFWGLVFSLIYGIFLMIRKKAKAGFSICMAPFFLGGAAASVIISFISYIAYGGNI
ncbi:MAG: prepilin peptidase [Ruminiclostridium sp.]